MNKLKIIIIVFILLISSGCYDYVEVNNLEIVSGMLIDYKDNKYYITTQVIDDNNEEKIKTYSNTCNNIDECIYKLSKVSNKEIFISHLKNIILTENTIKSNVNYYDYFLRETKSKMNFNIYYAPDKYKDDIIKSINSIYIKDLTSSNDKMYSSSISLSFLDLIQKKLDYGIEPVYPSISIDDNKIILDSLIMFDGDKKIVLNDTNSIFYNILTNKMNKTIIDIPCDENSFSLILDNINTDYKWENNTMQIITKGKTNINYYNCKYELNKKDTIDKLSNIANKYIEENLNNVLDIAKNNNYDFIGIGKYIYKHDTNFFNFKKDNWNNNLKNIDIKVKSNLIINSLGEMKNEL